MHFETESTSPQPPGAKLDRRALRRAFRSLPDVDASTYGPGLVRLRLRRDDAEVTVTDAEVPAFVRWVRDLRGRNLDSRRVALPVSEYREPHWGWKYRWSFAAELVYRARPTRGRR